MRKFFSYHLAIRLVSAGTVIVVLLAGFLSHIDLSAAMEAAFAAASAVLLLYPSRSENVLHSLAWASAFAAVFLSSYFFVSDFKLPVALSAPVVAAVCLLRSKRRFIDLKRLFSPGMAWVGLEDCSRNIYAIAYLCIGIFSILIRRESLALSVLYAVLYLFLYLRAYTGRSFFISSKNEDRLKLLISSRSSDSGGCSDELKLFYGRLVEFMTVQRPFLDDNLTIESLARKMGTNRTYLSRAINICFGNNFNQFVNSFRINYAVSLLKKDPRIKMWELAVMCGFHNQVSFTAAFKFFVHQNPADYARQGPKISIPRPSSCPETEP